MAAAVGRTRGLAWAPGAGPCWALWLDHLQRGGVARSGADLAGRGEFGDLRLVLSADQLRLEYVFGRWPEGQRYEVLASVPQGGDWQLAIERFEGDGLYRVLQQPVAANGWQGIVRVDDGITWQNQTRLVVWAVPNH